MAAVPCASIACITQHLVSISVGTKRPTYCAAMLKFKSYQFPSVVRSYNWLRWHRTSTGQKLKQTHSCSVLCLSRRIQGANNLVFIGPHTVTNQEHVVSFLFGLSFVETRLHLKVK